MTESLPSVGPVKNFKPHLRQSGMKPLASIDGTTTNARTPCGLIWGLIWEGRPSVPLGRELAEAFLESTVTLRLGRDSGSERQNLPEPAATEVDVVLWNLYRVSAPVHEPPLSPFPLGFTAAQVRSYISKTTAQKS